MEYDEADEETGCKTWEENLLGKKHSKWWIGVDTRVIKSILIQPGLNLQEQSRLDQMRTPKMPSRQGCPNYFQKDYQKEQELLAEEGKEVSRGRE